MEALTAGSRQRFFFRIIPNACGGRHAHDQVPDPSQGQHIIPNV
jgi:hypothetical protein